MTLLTTLFEHRTDEFAGIGTVSLSGTCSLTLVTEMAASGAVSLSGESWLTVREHGEDTLTATGFIRVAGLCVIPPVLRAARTDPIRLTTTETYPATSGGWTTSTVTPPDIREDA